MSNQVVAVTSSFHAGVPARIGWPLNTWMKSAMLASDIFGPVHSAGRWCQTQPFSNLSLTLPTARTAGGSVAVALARSPKVLSRSANFAVAALLPLSLDASSVR